MRAFLFLLAACATPRRVPASTPPPPAADAPQKTTKGTTFVLPAHWTILRRDAVTILTPPDAPSSHVVFVETAAQSPDAARDEALQLYRPDFPNPIISSDDAPGRNGWTTTRRYVYGVPLKEDRLISVTVAFGNAHWTAAILDIEEPVMTKHATELSTIFDNLRP